MTRVGHPAAEPGTLPLALGWGGRLALHLAGNLPGRISPHDSPHPPTHGLSLEEVSPCGSGSWVGAE